MRRWWLLLCVGACTQAFDIEPTGLAPPDRDGDFVPDDVDTCVDRPNPGAEQLDSDGDGRGDACDVCPQLASENQHDEDRDGLGDECDPCPALGDFGDDTDGDGVGDRCDPNTGIVTRRLFDPFTSITTRYTVPGTPWISSGDTAVPAARLTASDTGLEARDVILTSGTWFITMGLHSESLWEDERHGIVIRDATGARQYACEVRCIGRSCSVYYGGIVDEAYTTTALVPDLELRFTYRVMTSTTAFVGCAVVPSPTNPSVGIVTTATEDAVWPSFTTQPTTELRFLEVIE